MSKAHDYFGGIITCLLLAGVGGFVYYSLYIYTPTRVSLCSKSIVTEQVGVAAAEVRQWLGRSAPAVTTCVESGAVTN